MRWSKASMVRTRHRLPGLGAAAASGPRRADSKASLTQVRVALCRGVFFNTQRKFIIGL